AMRGGKAQELRHSLLKFLVTATAESRSFRLREKAEWAAIACVTSHTYKCAEPRKNLGRISLPKIPTIAGRVLRHPRCELAPSRKLSFRSRSKGWSRLPRFLPPLDAA